MLNVVVGVLLMVNGTLNIVVIVSEHGDIGGVICYGWNFFRIIHVDRL